MSDIFLSYKSEDRAKAQLIAELLEQQGCSVWWDRIIPVGKTFDEVIEEKLDAAKCVVVLWSEKSIQSKWVRTEAAEGNDRGILFPVLIEKVKVPLAFRRIQAANLVDWKGTPDHPQFQLLLRSVTEILGHPPSPPEKRKEEEERKEKEKQEKEEHDRLQKLKEEEERAKRAEQERLHRQKEQKEQKTFTNSIGMKFVLIPAGEFMMEEEEYEKPVHNVTISKPFYLGVSPVTQKEWKAVMGDNPSYFKGDDLPVESVSWNDVQEFIKKLNEKENIDKYRLPSESEWEYAARAGTTTKYYFGDDESNLGDYAWYYDNSDSKTHPVGEKQPNPWGLYDMHGNVWEWVQDSWHANYNGAPDDGSAWEDEDGAIRVYRGGGWRAPARYCRSAYRDGDDPGYRDCALGFRLLQDV
jgi:formylglycine-generating enzyme required for sulfatase activity